MLAPDESDDSVAFYSTFRQAFGRTRVALSIESHVCPRPGLLLIWVKVIAEVQGNRVSRRLSAGRRCHVIPTAQ
jgi:hypothetical protein